VFIDLTPFGMAGMLEELCCDEMVPGEFVVCCLPFFARGIAFGDLVSAAAGDSSFKSVLRRSGLRTLRCCFADTELVTKYHERVHGILSRLRHPHEWHGCGQFAVLLKELQAEAETLQLLAPFIEDNILAYEVEPEPFHNPCSLPESLTDAGEEGQRHGGRQCVPAAWKEERSVSANLTLQYDQVMFILDRTRSPVR
jgi:hypothetical protein